MGDADRLTPEGLVELARHLDPEKLAEVADFIGFLTSKQERELASVTRAWLDADLSRLGEQGPYDWGSSDPLEGEAVYWDEEQQALMVVTGD